MTTARVARLGELASVCRGYSPRPQERKPNGKYLLIGGRNIASGRLVKTEKDSYIDDARKESFRRAIARPGDIIVSTLFDRRKLCIYRETDPQAVINSSCAIIRAPETNDYIVSYLQTLQGRDDFLHSATNATVGSLIPRLSISDLSQIEIPLLPVAELQRLGDEHIQASTNDELIALRNDLRKFARTATANSLPD
jgi:restriction endonuclease S subunit